MTARRGGFRHPQSAKTEAIRLRAEGLLHIEISKAIGVPRATVNEWLRGVPAGERAKETGTTPDMEALRAEVIRLRLDKGWNKERIKQATGASWNQVDRWLFELGQTAVAEPVVSMLPDTRDLTGKLCGDPHPSRSALAQRSQSA